MAAKLTAVSKQSNTSSLKECRYRRNEEVARALFLHHCRLDIPTCFNGSEELLLASFECAAQKITSQDLQHCSWASSSADVLDVSCCL